MTEREKMLSGALYWAGAPELVQARRRAKELCSRFNQEAVQDPEAGARLLRELLGEAGDDISIQPMFWCDYGCNIRMGSQIEINHNCVILDCAPVAFGDHVFIGPNCGFYTADSKKGLNWYDYGARHYDAVLGRFTTNDRFAEKYYSMSPYQYGANSPVGNIDVNGDSIRVYTETQSFGHTWISVGEGSNMTVYSYGRCNGTNKGPDRSSNSLGNGSGVLLKLMGDEAKAYNDKKAAGGMSVFVVTDVADEKVANILDEKFNMSTTMPDNPKSDYYNSSSARIIDEYKLTSNNCTTMVSDVLNKSGSNALKETRLQQTSNFGTWTTIPIVNRFILPISMQNHLVRISKPGGVVYKTR